MEKYDIEKLRSLPCEGVAQRLGLTVKHHKALCPFHDDHNPSMTFRKGRFRCWSCGASGDVITLAQKVLAMNFADSCKWLADENSIILTDYKPRQEMPPRQFDASRYARFFEHPWLSDEARHFLFEERGIDHRVAAWCRLTSWKDRQGTPWLQFPYFDREGRLIGIESRNLVKGASPRYRFHSGSATAVYAMPVLNSLRQGDRLWIAEGPTDCLAMLSSGRKAIAIPSATLLTDKDAHMLRLLASELSTEFHMAPDADVPGEQLFMQLSRLLPSLQRHQLPPGCKDFGEYYAAHRKKNSDTS